jgi:hypothetical protein
MKLTCERCTSDFAPGPDSICPICGFPPTGDPDFFGPFEILSLLGRGGVAIVFKACQEDDEPVALKVLASTRKALVEQFVTEGMLSARVSHPNIVRILNTGEADGHRFITFEYVDGPSFARALASKAFGAADAARIVATTARALLHAHRKGIVHRDITPGNILLTPAGVPKLTDFGLALATETKSSQRSGVTAGTPVYMSPEQAAGMHDVVDARSDIYSLGAVLYEALAGRPPFVGTSIMEILRKVRTDPPPALENVDAALGAIVTKAMDKDPARRWPSMKELADELQKWVSAREAAPSP